MNDVCPAGGYPIMLDRQVCSQCNLDFRHLNPYLKFIDLLLAELWLPRD
jgi:hypothetical protein